MKNHNLSVCYNAGITECLISIISNNVPNACARRLIRFTVVYPRDRRRTIQFLSSISRIVLLFVILVIIILYDHRNIMCVLCACL